MGLSQQLEVLGAACVVCVCVLCHGLCGVLCVVYCVLCYMCGMLCAVLCVCVCVVYCVVLCVWYVVRCVWYAMCCVCVMLRVVCGVLCVVLWAHAHVPPVGSRSLAVDTPTGNCRGLQEETPGGLPKGPPLSLTTSHRAPAL